MGISAIFAADLPCAKARPLGERGQWTARRSLCEPSMDDNIPQLSEADHFSARSGAALRELEERARAALATGRDHVARLEAEITAKLDAIVAALTQEASQAVSEEVQKTQLAELEQKLAQQHASWTEQQNAWAALQTTLERERDELGQKLELAQGEVQQVRERVVQLEQELAQQQASWTEQQTAWAVSQSALERERDELRQKLEQVQEDAERVHERVAQLEQELIQCSQQKQNESAELAALRAERDTLAERVAELESHLPDPTDSTDLQQQLCDLQQRFELALEDVRELKAQNAQLEAELATARQKPAAFAAGNGGMDWESQKRRLLASLEDADPNDPVAQTDRETIENTIEMTDAVIAAKDREIAELKAQLSAGVRVATDEEKADQKVEALLDRDEVINEHRKKIAQLEREMEEKLRTTELELSLERAKIARQKTELEQLRADLEAQRRAISVPGTASQSAAPRRRWLSKLGLGGEET